MRDDGQHTMDIGPPQKLTLSMLCLGELKTVGVKKDLTKNNQSIKKQLTIKSKTSSKQTKNIYKILLHVINSYKTFLGKKKNSTACMCQCSAAMA